MLYTEYFTLRDCSGFLLIRSHFSLDAIPTKLCKYMSCSIVAPVTNVRIRFWCKIQKFTIIKTIIFITMKFIVLINNLIIYIITQPKLSSSILVQRNQKLVEILGLNFCFIKAV